MWKVIGVSALAMHCLFTIVYISSAYLPADITMAVVLYATINYPESCDVSVGVCIIMLCFLYYIKSKEDDGGPIWKVINWIVEYNERLSDDTFNQIR